MAYMESGKNYNVKQTESGKKDVERMLLKFGFTRSISTIHVSVSHSDSQ